MLDIIVPCYNEDESIKLFYEKTEELLQKIKHNYIFINDGSTDNTLKILKELYNHDKEKVKIISFSRNFGKEAALYAGLTHSKGKYTAIIDADLQQNPKYLVKMHDFLEKNKDYDCIAMCQKHKKKRFLQKNFYKVMDKLTDIHIEEGASDFRMLRHKMVASICELSEKNRFSKGLFSFVGFNTYYDTYIVEKRKHGKTKWSLKSLFGYAINGIISFSIKPIRLVTYIGLLTSFIAFIYLIFTIITTIINNKPVPGYASLMCVILFLGGIIIISLGIIGEYVGKIYQETKNRPIYISKEKIGFDEELL